MIISKRNLREKQVLFATETRCASIIASGTVNYRTKRFVLGQLKKTTDNKMLVSFFLNEYDKLVRITAKRRGQARRDTVYEFMKKEYDTIQHLKNAIWLEKDQQKKIDTLENDLASTDNIFFLCSVHENCAPDHADYQGKLYVAEDWRNRTKDKRVARYITTHNLRTVESVCYDAPYLLTRPNCKHTLRPIRPSTVLSGEWRDELEYVVSDRKNLGYIKYHQKEMYLREINKAAPSTVAKKDIAKARALMRKHAKKIK